MYAISMVSIPQYVLPCCGWYFLKLTGFKWISALTIGQPLWLVLYQLILFVLSIAFAFVNVSGEQISERMRKSGEYIYGDILWSRY